jgi:hypothetical protein
VDFVAGLLLATLQKAQDFARDLIATILSRREGIGGGVEDYPQEFKLSSREGLAVMALAESLHMGAILKASTAPC